MSGNPVPHEITDDEILEAIQTGEPIIDAQKWNDAFRPGASSVFVGLKADRPEPKKKGRVYICTDSQEIFYDLGNQWELLGCLVSKPPPGGTKIINFYYDTSNEELVLETE